VHNPGCRRQRRQTRKPQCFRKRLAVDTEN
jgi:hypothetical protein